MESLVRKLEKGLLVRAGMALGVVLVATMVAIGVAQFLQVSQFMSQFETGLRLRMAVMGTVTMVSVLLLAFTGLSLWIGKLVSRYVAERDRLRVAKDMELASSIQLGSMPQTFPPFPDEKAFDIYATMRPAKEVGGDFYDFYIVRPGRIVFLVADVSGKGVPAALFMMRAKSLLKGFIQTGAPLDEAVAKANDILCEGNAAGLFVTAWIAELNLHTGRIVYVNAGHNRPIRRHASDRTADYVEDEPCLFLGAMDGVPYVARELQLKPGDSLYLYTDGITEQVNDKNGLFGEERLLKVMREAKIVQKTLLDYVMRCVKRYAGKAEQFDDCTQLEIVWRGEPSVRKHDYEPTMEGLAKAAADLENDLDELPFDLKMTILTAADEIFVNIIRYSGATKWSLSVERAAFPDEVRVVFEDDGKPFDPLALKDPDTSIAIEDRQVGGLGIFIVKKTMSPVTYARRDGRNVLTMGKTLEVPAEPPIEPADKSLAGRKVRPV